MARIRKLFPFYDIFQLCMDILTIMLQCLYADYISSEANWITLYSYTENPLKCFDLIALHHSEFDWLNNEHDFLLNRCNMTLPLFLVCKHKERLCKYRVMMHCSVTSIITHVCVVLKHVNVKMLFGASWGEWFWQLIDIEMVTSI